MTDGNGDLLQEVVVRRETPPPGGDPFAALAMYGPFLPLYHLAMFVMNMQRVMMVGMTAGLPMAAGQGGNGYKVVQLRRDTQGNIVEIFERW